MSEGCFPQINLFNMQVALSWLIKPIFIKQSAQTKEQPPENCDGSIRNTNSQSQPSSDSHTETVMVGDSPFPLTGTSLPETEMEGIGSEVSSQSTEPSQARNQNSFILISQSLIRQSLIS